MTLLVRLALFGCLISCSVTTSTDAFTQLQPKVGERLALSRKSQSRSIPTAFRHSSNKSPSHPINQISGGSIDAVSEGSEGKALVPSWAVTGFLVMLWYAASIVCNQTSKVLLSTSNLGVQGLTFAQFFISAMVGAINLFVLRITKYAPVVSSAQWRDTTVLAGTITAGFGTLNACMSAMHVSLVMVLRAAEPAVTLLLAALLLPKSELPPPLKACMLLPVIAGAALSSLGAHAPTSLGIALALICNVCFGMRGILSKRMGASYKTDAFSEFFHLCLLGAGLQGAFIGVSSLALGTALPVMPPVSSLSTLLLSGVSFFAYVQLSWVCLGRMSAVSHSLTNSLRRPATILAALVYAPMKLSSTNIAGIVLACLGGLLYGIF